MSVKIRWNRIPDLGGAGFSMSRPQYPVCQANSVAPVVGDSPKGPLNNQGQTRLKLAKNAKRKSICTPKAHIQHNHDTGGPRGPPGQHSRCLSRLVRLARGIDAPSGGVRHARGLYAPSGGIRLARGLDPAPRARSASLEG
jgi:hypothetical protein